jgi:periplasmic protein TonB
MPNQNSRQWRVEVTIAVAPGFQLPWSATDGEDQRFKGIVIAALVVLLILSFAVSLWPVPDLEREEKEQLPPQLAKVLLEKQEIPVPKPKPKPPEKKVPPKKKPEPKKEKPEPKKRKPAPVSVSKAREKASVSGVLQFQDDLQAMRDSFDVKKVKQSDLKRSNAVAEKQERSLITAQVKVASGGVNAAELSRDTGGVALSGRETTRVESKLQEAGTGIESVLADDVAPITSRSIEDIRKVMDRNKGGVFAVYNRALRKNPALQGKFVFEMVIEPSGQISAARLISSELNDSALERKLMARIRLINFGAEDVTRTTLNYTFTFLPY